MTDTDSYQNTMQSLGFSSTDIPAGWKTGWEESETNFTEGKKLFFAADLLETAYSWIELNDAQKALLQNTLQQMQNDAAALRLAWHCQQILTEQLATADEGAVWSWARLPETHPLAAGFYGIVVLACIPHMLELHRTHGTPTDITRATLTDVRRWMDEYEVQYGHVGFANCGWLQFHLRGGLYELGRLQFNHERHRLPFYTFRNRQTSQTVTLAQAGQRFRQDGQFDGTNGIHDNAAWEASFEETSTHWRGCRIHPHGFAEQETITLPRPDWELVLKEGDPVLGIHIPAAGPMKHADCGESFTQATAFFQQYFPDCSYRAFTCNSWLLDPQLADYLPAESNIIRFLREFYLVPVPAAADTQLLQRIFNYQFTSLDTAPQESSLQRAIVQHMKSGGHWRNQGGFILPDDLAWGTQVYQTQQE